MLIVGAALVAIIVVAATGFMVADRSQSDTYAATPLVVKNYAKSIEDCQSAAVQEIRFVRFDYTAFQQVWFTCANQVYLVDLMEDFDIRREKLTRQELDERVVLWMVVAITISGVFLAGLQLLGSYRTSVGRHREIRRRQHDIRRSGCRSKQVVG